MGDLQTQLIIAQAELDRLRTLEKQEQHAKDVERERELLHAARSAQDEYQRARQQFLACGLDELGRPVAEHNAVELLEGQLRQLQLDFGQIDFPTDDEVAEFRARCEAINLQLGPARERRREAKDRAEALRTVAIQAHAQMQAAANALRSHRAKMAGSFGNWEGGVSRI